MIAIDYNFPWRRKNESVAKLIPLIEENVSNPNFGVSDLADSLSLSTRQLGRKVKKYTGFTPILLIRQVKLRVAKKYLETGRYKTVSEVCYAVGFEKPSYFSRIFKERFGKNPSEYLYSNELQVTEYSQTLFDLSTETNSLVFESID